eukprot:391641_1
MLPCAVLVSTWLTFTKAQSPDTICVWNAKDDFDRYNGEYVKANTHNGYDFWRAPTRLSNSECSGKKPEVYAIQDSSNAFYWNMQESMKTSVSSSTGGPYPTCKLQPSSVDPTACVDQWYAYHDSDVWDATPLELTVTEGACP